MNDGLPADRLAELAEPFDPSAVHWRAQTVYNGKALALAYLDARNVMERLDSVCGPANWQDRYEETPKGRVICTLSLNVDGYWVSKSDGAGDTDVEGDKGAVSDALKRAAVKWGIGRYLYGLGNIWVPCEVNDKGKFKKFTDDPWKYAKGLPAPKVATITDDQRDLITTLAQAANVTLQRICDGYGIKDLRELHADQFETVKNRLNATIDANKQKEAA